MSGKITRQEFFRKSAIYGTGVGVAAVGTGFLLPDEAKAGTKNETWPAPYDELDVETVRINAHDDFCTEGKGCSYAAFNAMVNLLRSQLPETFPSFPNEIMYYGHGGVAGWGTICGAINGPAALISMVCDKAGSDQLINELCGWYTQAMLPTDISNTYGNDGTFTVVKSDEILTQNDSGSVLCHISCSKWCNASGIPIGDARRKERCARVTGDVAAKAAQLLNDHFGDGFVGEYVPPATIASCMACHGSEGVKKNVASKSECEQCHGDYSANHGANANQSMAANDFSLEQNFPNPFSNGTTINFSLEKEEPVSIEIYNLEGKRVKTLINNVYHPRGAHSIQWDGTDNQGGSVKAGVYIFRFRAGNRTKSLSMMKV